MTVLAPLAMRVPPRRDANPELILSRFLEYVASTGLSLYAAQEEALLEVFAGRNVILNTPTGSGKSLVATAMHFKALAEGKRSFYTSPIKALASEKFFALCELLGADNVGMITGDASINRDAPVICCTAEILANIALREGADAAVDYAILDEFHYYADRDRGTAWEVPLLVLSRATFLLMSATLGDTDYFRTALTKLTGRETAVVRSDLRPVPLDYEYRETPLHETIEALVEQRRSPVYAVCFTQRACAEEAQNLMSTNFCTREEKQAIHEALLDAKFDSPYGKDIAKYLRHGIGLHHAGLLPKYRLLVEKLAPRGLLKIICGTDTLGVGVNIPIRTVLFTKLCKYDGEKTTILSVRDFKQICGRAGRKGFDDQGSVVAQAPEHVIENLKLEAKAAGDSVKLRRLVRRKPPEKGYVHWDRQTFDRLIQRPPEELTSRFVVSHGMLLNLLQSASDHRGGGYGRLIELINRSHGSAAAQRQHRHRARVLFRSLVTAGIVRLEPSASGKSSRVRVADHLQHEFSLHQTLSLFLLDALERIDPDAPDHAVCVLTLVESIMEDPDVVLMKQLDRIKTDRIDELKADGVPYEERMAELEKLEYPKPMREFIYDTFNAFALRHPWVGHENIRPKSVAREMFESGASFDEYVRDYGLQRSEGLLLRYLSDVYKALSQTVPDRYRDDAVLDVLAFMRTTVRHVDSSLLDEWEGMQSERAGSPRSTPVARQPSDAWREPRAIAAQIRAELQRLVRALAARDWDRAASLLRSRDDDERWDAGRIESAMAPYFSEYGQIVLDQEARSPKHARVTLLSNGRWQASQTIVDPSGDLSWQVEAEVELDPTGPVQPALELKRIGA